MKIIFDHFASKMINLMLDKICRRTNMDVRETGTISSRLLQCRGWKEKKLWPARMQIVDKIPRM